MAPVLCLAETANMYPAKQEKLHKENHLQSCPPQLPEGRGVLEALHGSASLLFRKPICSKSILSLTQKRMTGKEAACISDFKVQALWLCRKFLTSAAILLCTSSYFTTAEKPKSNFLTIRIATSPSDSWEAWNPPVLKLR